MIGPDHPDFEKLPRKEQARILHEHFGWTKEALEDEYGVSHTTVKRWLDPEYAKRQMEKTNRWQKTPKGQAVRERYRNSEKGREKHREYNRERNRRFRQEMKETLRVAKPFRKIRNGLGAFITQGILP